MPCRCRSWDSSSPDGTADLAKAAAARQALDAHTHEIVQWHFNPETGCPFWLDKQKDWGIDVRKEVKAFADQYDARVTARIDLPALGGIGARQFAGDGDQDDQAQPAAKPGGAAAPAGTRRRGRWPPRSSAGRAR